MQPFITKIDHWPVVTGDFDIWTDFHPRYLESNFLCDFLTQEYGRSFTGGRKHLPWRNCFHARWEL